ncbi:hypothetical protein TNIN_205011 [Trichonephila inaurata madagascariensis]|uniref:Uncharacterized protein n=1 Tax=Trichonephila inaurata madagascariensis TaxID=2747483 RepID=A0A8X7CRL3_9ARAC|nr:hypothetical protein TNIN_205011 [Trichonephila inaurata madagascariensis]
MGWAWRYPTQFRLDYSGNAIHFPRDIDLGSEDFCISKPVKFIKADFQTGPGIGSTFAYLSDFQKLGISLGTRAAFHPTGAKLRVFNLKSSDFRARPGKH